MTPPRSLRVECCPSLPLSIFNGERDKPQESGLPRGGPALMRDRLRVSTQRSRLHGTATVAAGRTCVRAGNGLLRGCFRRQVSLSLLWSDRRGGRVCAVGMRVSDQSVNSAARTGPSLCGRSRGACGSLARADQIERAEDFVLSEPGLDSGEPFMDSKCSLTEGR